MNKETILPLIRHTLTFAGGIIAGKGYASDGQITELTGAIMTIVSVIWYLIDSKKKNETPKPS